MNRNHLAVFHAVAEEGSFSRGAEQLCISQPAVSKQVAELESTLKMRLFDRLPKGVRLTDTGVLLLEYARRMAALEAEAERALEEARGLKRGRLAIGASTTIGVYLLPDVLGTFRRRHPEVELHLEIGNTEEIQKQLLDNRLDLGLTEGFVEAKELEARVFREDELVLIAPPKHPFREQAQLSLERVCQEPFLLREPGSGTRAVVERALGERGLSVRPVLSLNSTEAIKRAVMAEIGLAFLSRLAIETELQEERLVVLPLTDFVLRRPLHRLQLRRKLASVAVRAFLRLLNA